MAIPDYQTLMLPVLRLASKGEQRVTDVADRVADEVGLTMEERETLLPSGRQRVLNNRIHWAKFYMSKAGLISSPARGRFVATEDGRNLLATNPDRINVALLMKSPSFREFYKTEKQPASDSMEVAFEEKATGLGCAPATGGIWRSLEERRRRRSTSARQLASVRRRLSPRYASSGAAGRRCRRAPGTSWPRSRAPAPP
jgi:hypothetical protein